MAFKDIPDNPTTAAKSSASSDLETQNFFDMAQPIVIVRNDTFAAPFTIRLNGNNHSTWSKMMLLHVSSQGKRDPIKGTQYPLLDYTSAHFAFITNLSRSVEPSTYAAAASNPNWRQAMSSELDALESNSTWTLTPLPAGKHPIGCRWVYKIKHNFDGSIEWYKACLVAEGYTQIEGVDFHVTFSPIAKMIIVCCLLPIVAAHSWIFHQMDVHNAFPYGDLHEEIYMTLSPSLQHRWENLVCRLNKSLYGLK
ncbi:unnamed protein product [Prunus brigantina]